MKEYFAFQWHIFRFEQMAEILAGYTNTCVISFIDLYKKVQRNFPQAKSVSKNDRVSLGKEFVRIGKSMTW